jgi:4-amino-4-deoxy-L-arabinose transferase-like glycosyltransferase
LTLPSRTLQAALAVAVISTWITPFQRELFIGDETKYAQVIREMRATGAFFLPTLGGAPFTHKPPLHFWMIDLLTFPLGAYSMWAFVLPSLIAFLFLMWLMWRMGGPLAAFICATSLMMWGLAQTARMDISFTALIVFGVWMLRQERLFPAAVAFGIATLIKGPMAPVIGIVLFLLEAWRQKRFPRVNYIAPIAAMIVIPLLWFVPAMLMGGSAYTHEVIVKQAVGRAVAAWVHKAPLYFYVPHLLLDLLPWTLLAIAALRRANRFYLSWIAAVLIPYSLMSSKLDVYMMALIPAVALMIAERPSIIANRLTLALMVVPVCFVGLVPLEAKPLLIILAVAAALALITWKSQTLSTIAVGLVPIIPLAYAAIAMMPLVNSIASTERLISALEKQHVQPEQIALYSCPNLWSRYNFPRELERVRYVGADDIGNATVIATSRVHAPEIANSLRGYHRVDQVQMLRKWFDVYRR